MTKDKIAVQIAHIHRNIPYVWGGKSPLIGLDCSGFTQDIYGAVGAMPRKPVMSSGMQWGYFQDCRVKQPREGCAVFYGTEDRIRHVMFCLSDTLCIGAAGGNKSCTTPAKAASMDARVQILPINYRDDIVGFVDPFRREMKIYGLVKGEKKSVSKGALPEEHERGKGVPESLL